LASSWSSSPDYAGFWPRAAALVIDGLIVAVIVVPVMVLGFGIREVEPGEWWELAVLGAVALAVVGFWRTCGATPGKIALALRIVDAKTGAPPKTLQLIVRFIAYAVSALPLYLGFLWVAVDRRKQGWHDKIAGTIVVNSEE
jgi:uncharacterized RDD family membrane protein YckC